MRASSCLDSSRPLPVRFQLSVVRLLHGAGRATQPSRASYWSRNSNALSQFVLADALGSNNSPTEPSSHDAPKQRQPLHPVLINALLHVRGGRCRIEITHYSQHGLSLDRATGVELDERVTVELGSGRRLPMRVAWVKGTTAGVRFLGPIVSERAVMRWLDEAVKMQKHRRSL